MTPPLCDHVWTGTQIRSSLNSASDQLIPTQPTFCADRRPFVAWARGALSGDAWILIWGVRVPERPSVALARKALINDCNRLRLQQVSCPDATIIKVSMMREILSRLVVLFLMIGCCLFLDGTDSSLGSSEFPARVHLCDRSSVFP